MRILSWHLSWVYKTNLISTIVDDGTFYTMTPGL